MKLHKLFAFLLTVVLLFSLCACGAQDTPAVTTAPATTEPATEPPETTVPPTTEEPHIELTREVIFQMLDEATALLNENETVTLQANKYTSRYISSNNLQETDYLSLSDNVITIQNAKNSDFFGELRYVILMTNLMEEFPDSYAEDNLIVGTYTIYQITFYTEYAAAGYSSAQEFIANGYQGQLSHTSYFTLSCESGYSVRESYYCYEDGMHQYIGHTPYHFLPYANEYEQYLQSKGEA